jgi:hypothetical protein
LLALFSILCTSMLLLCYPKLIIFFSVFYRFIAIFDFVIYGMHILIYLFSIGFLYLDIWRELSFTSSSGNENINLVPTCHYDLQMISPPNY